MAWRVTPVPVVSRRMEADPSSHRRTTSFSRTASPNAAKSGTESSISEAANGSALRKVFLDELKDPTPTLLVGGEGFHAARQRDLVEAGFGDGEHDAVRNFFQCEFDERGGHAGIDDQRAEPRERENGVDAHEGIGGAEDDRVEVGRG